MFFEFYLLLHFSVLVFLCTCTLCIYCCCVDMAEFYLFIYLGFYVAFNTVQVISQRVVGRAEETSTYSSSGLCTVNCRPTVSNYQLSNLRPCWVYLGFYVAFNTIQVISRRVVGRAEETSTYSSLGLCTVNCRPTASNYQLSHLRPSQGSNPRPQRWEARVLPLCHPGPPYMAEKQKCNLRSGKTDAVHFPVELHVCDDEFLSKVLGIR